MVLNNRSGWLVFFWLMLNAGLEAQQVKYFIRFTDKNDSPYSTGRPSEFMGQQSVIRRSNYNITYDHTDLPVNPWYIEQVRKVPHVTVMFASKWFNGVLVRFDSPEVAGPAMNEINNLSFVSASEKVRRSSLVQLPNPSVQQPAKVSFQADASETAYKYGGSFWQNRQLNVDCLHEQGFRGQGITIAVMDAGFSTVPQNPVFDSLRNYGNLLGTVDFVDGGTNAYVGGDHGTYVLSCMAANIPDLIIGSAPMAKYWLLRTEEGAAETISEEYNWIRAAEFADSAGADILTTSLGYTTFDDPSQNHSYATLDGRTAPMSIAGTMAARKGLFVLNAAGNSGQSSWRYIGVPADADSICSVGAIDSAGNVVAFSSVGPTADGRIKPDLVARGAGAWVSVGNAVCFPASGTSFSTPILAGAVACYWQARRNLRNMQVLSALKRTASDWHNPNNSSGWGVPNVCASASKADFDFAAWADPSASVIRINLADNSYDYIKIGMYDLLGRRVFYSEPDKNDLTISFYAFNFTDNMYVLRIETSEGSKVKKIIKQ